MAPSIMLRGNGDSHDIYILTMLQSPDHFHFLCALAQNKTKSFKGLHKIQRNYCIYGFARRTVVYLLSTN